MKEKSRPLYESTRQTIWSAIYHEKYKSKQLDLDMALRANALDFYNDMYPTEIQNRMAGLPHNAFKNAIMFYLILGPQKLVLHMESPKPFFYIDPKKSYNSDHPLTVARTMLLDNQSDYKKIVDGTRMKVMILLNSVNTTKQLLESWPEVGPFIPPGKRITEKHLPAIPVQQVNELLGLK